MLLSSYQVDLRREQSVLEQRRLTSLSVNDDGSIRRIQLSGEPVFQRMAGGASSNVIPFTLSNECSFKCARLEVVSLRRMIANQQFASFTLLPIFNHQFPKTHRKVRMVDK